MTHFYSQLSNQLDHAAGTTLPTTQWRIKILLFAKQMGIDVVSATDVVDQDGKHADHDGHQIGNVGVVRSIVRLVLC